MKFVRRDFLKISGVGAAVGSSATAARAVGSESGGEPAPRAVKSSTQARPYNGSYSGPHLNRVAFPIGGIGAGMICLEGTGAFSHGLNSCPAFLSPRSVFGTLTSHWKWN